MANVSQPNQTSEKLTKDLGKAVSKEKGKSSAGQVAQSLDLHPVLLAEGYESEGKIARSFV